MCNHPSLKSLKKAWKKDQDLAFILSWEKNPSLNTHSTTQREELPASRRPHNRAVSCLFINSRARATMFHSSPEPLARGFFPVAPPFRNSIIRPPAHIRARQSSVHLSAWDEIEERCRHQRRVRLSERFLAVEGIELLRRRIHRIDFLISRGRRFNKGGGGLLENVLLFN